MMWLTLTYLMKGFIFVRFLIFSLDIALVTCLFVFFHQGGGRGAALGKKTEELERTPRHQHGKHVITPATSLAKLRRY